MTKAFKKTKPQDKKAAAATTAEDELNLPSFAESRAESGAVLDSLDDKALQMLPRILRYAVQDDRRTEKVELRLYAEILEVAPDAEHAQTWIDDDQKGDAAIALAAALDRNAVILDKPECRSLADSLRLLTLPVPKAGKLPPGYSRVAKSVVAASKEVFATETEPFWVPIEEIVCGWAALPLMKDEVPVYMASRAWQAARYIGARLAKNRIAKAKEEAETQNPSDEEPRDNETGATFKEDLSSTANILVVCRLDEKIASLSKMKDITKPLGHAINTPLPLVAVPDLRKAHAKLMFEFPYAERVIDTVLNDLVGRETIRIKSLILVGEPGGGKSRFVRRLGDVLGLGVWRTDASRSDGAIFGGTDKRWHSAEPCHPFLAIAQARQANPLVLIDEIEKAGTRSDYGRFWDCLLGFLEQETASRYPDPALQTNLNLSQVSYLATANSVDPLPSPLRDRFRVLTFPRPRPDDLGALLPPVIAEIAKDRGLNPTWIPPLAGFEQDFAKAQWNGGSVRRLRTVIEAIIRARDMEKVMQ